jgi:hypothetical protein
MLGSISFHPTYTYLSYYYCYKIGTIQEVHFLTVFSIPQAAYPAGSP